MQSVEEKLINSDFSFVSKDLGRPWGGFWVIKEQDAFLEKYFQQNRSDKPISPKILYVNAGKKLSWQYHHRRREIWKVIEGPVGVIRSKTDQLGNLVIHQTGDLIELEKEERHRLVGLDNPGVVAEIWVHIDPNNLSNEEDIVRVQDDFNRL